jgi:DNA-directed RNA polymerase subunit RPC12/RpoP
MGEPTIEVLCKNCGQTFTAFLKEMAAKNAEVTCPYCGKSAGNPPQNSAMPACRIRLKAIVRPLSAR